MTLIRPWCEHIPDKKYFRLHVLPTDLLLIGLIYWLCTFLCHVIYSSLRIALRKLGSLYCGWTRHLAAATIDAVRGPITPIVVRNSAMLGVSLNGTGLFASNSPERKINSMSFNLLLVWKQQGQRKVWHIPSPKN